MCAHGRSSSRNLRTGSVPRGAASACRSRRCAGATACTGRPGSGRRCAAVVGGVRAVRGRRPPPHVARKRADQRNFRRRRRGRSGRTRAGCLRCRFPAVGVPRKGAEHRRVAVVRTVRRARRHPAAHRCARRGTVPGTCAHRPARAAPARSTTCAALVVAEDEPASVEVVVLDDFPGFVRAGLEVEGTPRDERGFVRKAREVEVWFGVELGHG